jgi:hypothetical protein
MSSNQAGGLRQRRPATGGADAADDDTIKGAGASSEEGHGLPLWQVLFLALIALLLGRLTADMG